MQGYVLAAFADPAACALWALACIHELHNHDWDPMLLRHEVRSPNACVPLASLHLREHCGWSGRASALHPHAAPRTSALPFSVSGTARQLC